jgi:hypothetical protein
MEDKITIIEGPPPTFEHVNDGWAIGLNESPFLYDLMITRLRTFNGESLVERCHRAWSQQSSIYLHYRNLDGLEEQVPIVAARTMETEDGPVLILWVRTEPDDVEVEFDIDDEDEEFDSDIDDLSDLDDIDDIDDFDDYDDDDFDNDNEENFEE